MIRVDDNTGVRWIHPCIHPFIHQSIHPASQPASQPANQPTSQPLVGPGFQHQSILSEVHHTVRVWMTGRLVPHTMSLAATLVPHRPQTETDAVVAVSISMSQCSLLQRRLIRTTSPPLSPSLCLPVSPCFSLCLSVFSVYVSLFLFSSLCCALCLWLCFCMSVCLSLC